MTTAKRRIEKLESGLTPKQAILLWLQETHAFNRMEEYVCHLKTQPDSAAPLHKLTIQVAEGVKQILKGKPKEEIDRAVRQAYKDVLFLFFLHQRVNGKLITEQRYYWSQAMLLTSKLGSMLREQSVLDLYRKGRDAEEPADDVSQLGSLLEDVQVEKKGQSAEQFRQQVEHWRELALRFLPEVHTLRKAIDSISDRYFEGQNILFSSDAEGLDELLALVEKTVNIFNESLVVDLERLERLLNETGDRQEGSPLTIDLARLTENTQVAAKEQAAYLVDMAKADALDLLGEPRKALELVDRHV
ncbi:MAG: hypothetical protein O2913_13995 [Chloroflexi bacterium]|nr:hypothetical protein [Chloroflexota bacterium]